MLKRFYIFVRPTPVSHYRGALCRVLCHDAGFMPLQQPLDDNLKHAGVVVCLPLSEPYRVEYGVRMAAFGVCNTRLDHWK
jgi:hypothetical protein